MASFTLRIAISHKDLEILSNAQYNLCLTRDVSFNGTAQKGNYVFAAVLSKDLGPNIMFQWKEAYQIYGITGLRLPRNPRAIVTTDIVGIDTGQGAIIAANGTINVSGSFLVDKPFQVQNQWKNPARTVVELYDSIEEIFSPIFASPEVPISSTSNILPSKAYSVFFDPQLHTGILVGESTATPPFPFNFSTNSEIRLSYTDGIWRLV